MASQDPTSARKTTAPEARPPLEPHTIKEPCAIEAQPSARRPQPAREMPAAPVVFSDWAAI